MSQSTADRIAAARVRMRECLNDGEDDHLPEVVEWAIGDMSHTYGGALCDLLQACDDLLAEREPQPASIEVTSDGCPSKCPPSPVVVYLPAQESGRG